MYKRQGLEIDLKAIPIRQETVEVCEQFHLNPYQLISSGSMLMAAPDGLGLVQALKILKGVKGISFVELNKKDIVRHKLVTQIVEAYEKFDKEAKAERERRKVEQADSKIEQKQ